MKLQRHPISHLQLAPVCSRINMLLDGYWNSKRSGDPDDYDHLRPRIERCGTHLHFGSLGLSHLRRMKLVENICLGMQRRNQTNNTDVLTYSPAVADIASRHQEAGCVIDYCDYNKTRRSCVEVRSC